MQPQACLPSPCVASPSLLCSCAAVCCELAELGSFALCAAVPCCAGNGYHRRGTDDSVASSQVPLVCHAGPELEEVVKGEGVSGVQFKESESEVGCCVGG
jgi:hypothetical protein